MPSLIVFDLDLTLWHCGPLLWCDQLRLPLHKNNDGSVQDADGVQVSLFSEVRELLDDLTDEGYTLALASRTSAPHVARQLLDFFEITHYFPYQEIYPGDKTNHFAALQAATALPFCEMLFFDDEPRNIEDVSTLGVKSHPVRHGISREFLRKAL